ncbi:hypothetical protein CHUAL_004911 [Chamberlinius hualienensis]
MSHPHGHTCVKECDHSTDEERGIEYSLYTKIDIDNVECLNEINEGSGKTVFRAWDERLRRDKVVESDDESELLFNIPFTGNIKLKGIIVIGGEEEESHPSLMRLFKDRPSISLDDAHNLEADQEFEMSRDANGTVEYATKIVKFSSIRNLSIHFRRNSSDDVIKIYYIGLKGEFTEARRKRAAICTYEASPNPADHKIGKIVESPSFIQ